MPVAGSKMAVILVVEDDFLQRMHAVTVIEEAGFTAITAANADEAIEILQDRDDIRVVFTDVEMPGSMDGLKLAHAIRDRWPPIELIVTSGHRLIEGDGLPARGRFLGKPYRPSALVEMIGRFAEG